MWRYSTTQFARDVVALRVGIVGVVEELIDGAGRRQDMKPVQRRAVRKSRL